MYVTSRHKNVYFGTDACMSGEGRGEGGGSKTTIRPQEDGQGLCVCQPPPGPSPTPDSTLTVLLTPLSVGPPAALAECRSVFAPPAPQVGCWPERPYYIVFLINSPRPA